MRADAPARSLPCAHVITRIFLSRRYSGSMNEPPVRDEVQSRRQYQRTCDCRKSCSSYIDIVSPLNPYLFLPEAHDEEAQRGDVPRRGAGAGGAVRHLDGRRCRGRAHRRIIVSDRAALCT